MHLELTPRQRRRQVIEILSSGLVRMPAPLRIPPEKSRVKSRESSKESLDFPAEKRLTVSVG